MTKRQTYVMANWKMNPLSQQDSNDLLSQFAPHFGTLATAQLVFFTNTLDCLAARAALPTHVAVGVQCVSAIDHTTGAYTGETSAAMCKARHIDYALVGHSERRHTLKESASTLLAQVSNSLAASLTVVFCVGEQLADRESNQALAVVQQQLDELLSLGSLVANAFVNRQIVVAYEPVWAIGTGKSASADDAQHMHTFIRNYLAGINPQFTDTSILYGGSVKASNAAVLANCPDVDGVLVGGASLLVEEFCGIIDAFN